MQDPKPKQGPSMLLPKEEIAHVKGFICKPQMSFALTLHSLPQAFSAAIG